MVKGATARNIPSANRAREGQEGFMAEGWEDILIKVTHCFKKSIIFRVFSCV
jgi:hypothetical protein